MSVPSPSPGGESTFDPAEGATLDVIAVDLEEKSERHGVGPIVVGVTAASLARQLAVKLAWEAGFWVVKQAWKAGTAVPVNDFTRPPVLWDKNTGLTYRLQPHGGYVQAGPTRSF